MSGYFKNSKSLKVVRDLKLNKFKSSQFKYYRNEGIRGCIDEEPDDAKDEANYAQETWNQQPARVETYRKK